MNVAAAAPRRILSGIAWVAFGVLAWATFTVLIGGSAAHAEEEPEAPLSPLTSLVGSTVDDVSSLATPIATEIVAPVVETVVETVVAPVVQQTAPQIAERTIEAVVSTPIVGDSVRPVLDPVAPLTTGAVEAVASPLTGALQHAPVATLTEPVLQTLSGIADGTVGEVLTDLGITGALREVVEVVDATADLIGGTAAGTVPPVLGALTPPAASEVPDTEPVAEAPVHHDESEPPSSARVDDAVVRAASEATIGRMSTHAFGQLSAAASDAPLAERDAAASTRPHENRHAPLAGLSTPLPSTGSGGGSHGDAARLGDSAFDPLHTWKRILGASDDALPSSPVAGTDVSPD